MTQAFHKGRGFSLAYQPIYDLASGTPVKVEALLRWRHPLSPGEFIPVAERTGQIAQIGLWVLSEACRAAQAWPQVCLSVNVSAVQLGRADFAAQVLAVLERSGLPPGRLELELIRIPIESSRFLDSIRLKGVGKDTDFAIWMHRRCSSDCAGI